jgi:acyl dehydratase
MSDLFFEDIEVGNEITTASRRVTQRDVSDFVRLSGDRTEHVENVPIVHGALVLAMATGMMSQTGVLTRSIVGFLEMKVRFIKMVRINDTLRTVGHVVSKRSTTSRADRGIVVLAITVLNQHEELVLKARWTLMVSKKPDTYSGR